jgi:hypothetical protein
MMKTPDLHKQRGKGRHSHRFTLRQIGKQVLATISEGSRHAHDVEGHITTTSDDGPDHRHSAFVDGVTLESGPPIKPMELGLHKEEIYKGIMPDLIDPTHEYVFKTGEYGIYDYWYRDLAGNYWRYTNAPEDHKDFDPRAGVPLMDKDQPMPHTAPQFFADNGRRRHSAVPKEVSAEVNASYDPLNMKNTWYETYQASDGSQRFIYLDSDVRENLDLWVQYQLRVTDAGISRYRQFAANMFNNPHPKDKIVGGILMLVDQGLYDLEDLADALVEDLQFIDETVKLLGRKFICDPPFFDFLTSLVANREPSDPLFVVDTVHGRHSFGYHYLYSVFKHLRVSPHYLLYWRASQMFTRIMTRLALTREPDPEEIEGLAMSELQRMFSTRDNIKHMVDHKVREQLLTNYGAPLQKALARQEADDYGVPALWSDLIQRRGDELQFSVWLHSEPMHDITPEEEAQIAEQTEATQEAREAEKPPEAGGEQGEAQPGTPGPGESGGGAAGAAPGGAG